MDIKKVELNLSQKNANPFKTTRKSDTNPFKYSNFEGNTLLFAEVFDGFDSKTVNFKGSKPKLVMTSVIGSITRLRNSVAESIVKFANRVKDGITSAWTYAKNTEIKIAGLDSISENIHNVSDNIQGLLNYDVGKGISDSLYGITKNISDRLSFLNKDVTEIGHDLSSRWNDLISSINIGNLGHEKISSDMPVARLRELWINENNLAAKSIDINHAEKMEVKVA